MLLKLHSSENKLYGSQRLFFDSDQLNLLKILDKVAPSYAYITPHIGRDEHDIGCLKTEYWVKHSDLWASELHDTG
jgi:hypothetical protein